MNWLRRGFCGSRASNAQPPYVKVGSLLVPFHGPDLERSLEITKSMRAKRIVSKSGGLTVVNSTWVDGSCPHHPVSNREVLDSLKVPSAKHQPHRHFVGGPTRSGHSHLYVQLVFLGKDNCWALSTWTSPLRLASAPFVVLLSQSIKQKK